MERAERGISYFQRSTFHSFLFVITSRRLLMLIYGKVRHVFVGIFSSYSNANRIKDAEMSDMKKEPELADR